MHRRSSSLFHLTALAVVATGCAGQSTRTTLPTAEREIADMLPEDAYFAVRADVAAIRGVPGWDAIAATLDATDPTAAGRWRTIDAVYFAIGGLEDITLPSAPNPFAALTEPVPEPGPAVAAAPEAVEGESVVVDEAALAPTTPSEPEWMAMARTLGERVPRLVIAFEGEDVSMCHALVEGGAHRRLGDYDVVAKDGFAFALRGRSVCVGTFEVMIDDVLARRHGTPRIVGRLHAAGEDGDAGLFGMAFELDAPGFTALMDAVAEGARTRPGEEPFPDPLASYRRVAERVFGELLRGIEAVEWQLGRAGTAYASRTRVQASDVDRGVMYRELVEVVLGIIAAVGESDVAGTAAGHVIDTLTSSTRVEPRDDGFVLVSRLSDGAVTQFLDGFVGGMSEESEDEDEEDEEGLEYDEEGYDFDGSARERIASLEPQLEALLADPASAAMLTHLASAYAHVGRFEEARVLLSRVAVAVPDGMKVPLLVGRAELELVTGHATEARAMLASWLAELGSDGSTMDPGADVSALHALAGATLGDPAALRRIDERVVLPHDEAMSMVIVRGRAALVRGRYADAANILGILCDVSAYAGCSALVVREALIEAVARNGASIALTDAFIDRFIDGLEAGLGEDAAPTGRYLACLVRALRAPQAEDTRDVCAAAEQLAIESHGSTHPLTAAVTLEHARVLAARRDRDGARRALARVDAVLATLGPSHPLHAQRAASGRRR